MRKFDLQERKRAVSLGIRSGHAIPLQIVWKEVNDKNVETHQWFDL